MNKYQQSVEGLMCRYWFDQCINATNQDAGLQFTCTQTRDSMCGNLTTTPESASTSSSASMTSRTTGGSGSSPTGSSGSSESSSAPKPAAAVPAFEYSTLTLVGGLAAVFGLVL
jgi:fluoride ion exporter CrcB/FEX